VKPQTQRLATVLKHGSGCYRNLSVTTLAMQQPPRRPPRLRAATIRTRKPIRPAHPLQVGRTIILRREPVQNLLKCPRIGVCRRGLHGHNTTHWGHLSQSARQVTNWPKKGSYQHQTTAAFPCSPPSSNSSSGSSETPKT
jgi:hypothetical protein